jgi:very-short-patch-repair endonuclease
MPHARVSDRQRGRAKQLRSTMTRAEALLWRYLKAHRVDGLSFRRQFPVQDYIADFVCLSARLVVELDGESHDFVERQAADRARDAFFASQGFETLRFTNEQVTSQIEGVVETIREAAVARVRCLPSSPGTPPSLSLPHKGGGNRETTEALAPQPKFKAEVSDAQNAAFDSDRGAGKRSTTAPAVRLSRP